MHNSQTTIFLVRMSGGKDRKALLAAMEKKKRKIEEVGRFQLLREKN
jgi:hypothetical protein